MDKFFEKADEVYDFVKSRRENLLSGFRQNGLDVPSTAVFRSCVNLAADGTTLTLNSGSDADPEVSEKDLSATFIISTPARDRYGDVVVPRGVLPHLGNYRRNPQVFFSHKSQGFPVGLSSRGDNLDVNVTDDWIKGTCHFHEETEEARVTFRLVAKKILRAASVGFLPVKAAILKRNDEDEEGNDKRPKKTPEGERILYFDGWLPLKFLEWDMTEWSIVPVPANPDALASYLSLGRVEDTPIPEGLKNALSPHAAKIKGYVHGVSREQLLLASELFHLNLDADHGRDADAPNHTDSSDQRDDNQLNDELKFLAAEPFLFSADQLKTFTPRQVSVIKDLQNKSLEQETLVSIHGAVHELKALFDGHNKSSDEQHKSTHKRLDDVLCSLKPPTPEKPVEQSVKAADTTDWAKILSAVSELTDGHKKLANKFFEITGIDL